MTGALVLDLDGVLRRWDPGVAAAAEQRHGLPAWSLERAAFAAPGLQDAVTGRTSDAQWRAGTAARLAARYGPRAVDAVAEWLRPVGSVDADVLRLVREERRRRPVAVLSDATDRLPADLAALGLDREVDAVLGSWELGVAGPDPAAFTAACSALGVEPARCLFVDDDAGHVRAAEDVGLRGRRITTAGRLAAFLRGAEHRR